MNKGCLLIIIIIFFSSCKSNSSCRITEIEDDLGLTHNYYDQSEDINRIIDFDIKTNKRDTFRYEKTENKIASYKNNKLSTEYNLDGNARIKYYIDSSGYVDLYEYNYAYDSLGFLTKITKERFVGETKSDLFVTTTFDLTYDNGNLIKMIENSIVDNTYGYGENWKTTYEIEYYKDARSKNNVLIKTLLGYINHLISPTPNGSAGNLPNYLMKSIIEKTEGQKSTVTNFTYDFKENGLVTNVIIERSKASGEPYKSQIAYKYDCSY